MPFIMGLQIGYMLQHLAVVNSWLTFFGLPKVK